MTPVGPDISTIAMIFIIIILIILIIILILIVVCNFVAVDIGLVVGNSILFLASIPKTLRTTSRSITQGRHVNDELRGSE